MKKRIFLSSVLALLAVSFILMAVTFCGRTASRVGGKDFRQVLAVEHCKDVVSVSFDKDGASFVKNVTFLAEDGYYYTQEFRDVSPLEGLIRWRPYGEGSDVFQSRRLSRIFGTATNLELPEDCAKILNVDVGYLTKNERVKNVVYLSKDGKVFAKEYREGLIDRTLEGWLEVKKQ